MSGATKFSPPAKKPLWRNSWLITTGPFWPKRHVTLTTMKMSFGFGQVNEQINLKKVFRVVRNTGESEEQVGEFFSLEEAVQSIPENSTQYWIEQDFVRVA